MKNKILLVLGILIFSIGNVFAAECKWMQCPEPYDLSNGVSRFVSVASGSNFLASRVAESILKKEISKTVDGKLSVGISSYSLMDLKKGIFKSLSIKGKNIVVEDVYFTSLNIQTLCDFNYIAQIDTKNPVIKEDMPLAFSVVMSEDDINKTMLGAGYKKVLDDLNMLGSSLGVFKITSSQIKIKDNKFYYILKVAIPFVRNIQNIVITSDLKVSRGQIDLTNTKLVNNNMLIDLKQLDKVINYINPLDFSLNILENKHADLTVQNIKIQDNKIYANGLIVVPKE